MKRVAILAETALSSGREILEGVARWQHERNDWTIFHHTGPLGAMAPKSMLQWQGDGIIARIADPMILRLVESKRVPVVDVLGNVRGAPFPLVKCDDAHISRLVADHFLESGHRHFAFLGLSDERWSLEREEAFAQAVRAVAEIYSPLQLSSVDRAAENWPQTLGKVIAFLQDFPLPLALMVASDQFGPLAIEACKQLHRSIPEEIAIASVDNDQPFCNLCHPRLTSVEPNHRQVGFEAARLLDRAMEGASIESPLREVPPLALHRRHSSDSSALSDPSLVKASQYIRAHACAGPSVDAVARHAGLSRSVLQRRFRSQLGHTVKEALLRVRLRRAQDMLSFTDLPLLEVAERSGFTYQEYLTQVFKRHLGTTPARFRKMTQGRLSAESTTNSE